jgi:hypothetical protein
VKFGSSRSRTASRMSGGWMVFLDARPACSAALQQASVYRLLPISS